MGYLIALVLFIAGVYTVYRLQKGNAGAVAANANQAIDALTAQLNQAASQMKDRLSHLKLQKTEQQLKDEKFQESLRQATKDN